MRRKVPHILKIILGACLFYLLFVLAQQFIWHDRDFTVNLVKLRNFILFNSPFIVAGQYWFLFALLYTYLLYAFMERCVLRNYEYLVAALMFVAYFCLAQGAHIIGVKVPNMCYRNWLIEGFAFFMLGRWTHEHQDSILISNGTILWIIAISTFMCLPERWALGRDFGVNICTLPQVFALFVYAIKNPDRHEGVVQRIGRDCSMLVYILHPFVWHSMERVYRGMGLSGNIAARYILPVIVVVLSILLAVLCNRVSALFKRKQFAV